MLHPDAVTTGLWFHQVLWDSRCHLWLVGWTSGVLQFEAHVRTRKLVICKAPTEHVVETAYPTWIFLGGWVLLGLFGVVLNLVEVQCWVGPWTGQILQFYPNCFSRLQDVRLWSWRATAWRGMGWRDFSLWRLPAGIASVTNWFRGCFFF